MCNKPGGKLMQRERATLDRSLGLPLTVLYGLGVTIGAGIYVLIGQTAGRAGMQAPFAFILAALAMAPSAGSFAELSSRLPFSAGEATYVKFGLRSEWLARLVGMLTIAVAIVSTATVSRGCAGYIQVLIDIPIGVIIVGLVLAMGCIAAWGIKESVAFAGLMTLIEISGLLMIVVSGIASVPDLWVRLPEAWPGLTNVDAWTGVLTTALLAFFAFTGFEGLANIAEEVKEPERTLPRAIFLTLGLVTLLYVLVVWVALIVVPRAELAATAAPLSLVFERVSGVSPAAITFIAIVATMNGIVVFILMGSRVAYGMAAQGLLPASLANVNSRTRTPLRATAMVVAIALVLSVLAPIESLAEMASRLTLIIFAFVNAALVKIKIDGIAAPAGAFTVPSWVPVAGVLTSLGLLACDLAY